MRNFQKPLRRIFNHFPGVFSEMTPNSFRLHLTDITFQRYKVRNNLILPCWDALFGKEYAYDIVRIGSFLHDIQLNSPLAAENVLTLETEVLQKYNLPAGNTVGYSATYTAQKDIKLAVISIGHGDGLRRQLGNKGFIHFYERNKVYKAPIVGNISMDLTTCDVTEIPDELTLPGSIATILSKDYRVKDMAQDAGLLSYEVLIGLQLKPERCDIIYKENE